MDEAVDALVTAIEIGRTDIVRSAVSSLDKIGNDETPEETLNSLLTSSGTLLHLAAKLGQADIARTLLAAGADPGVHNEEEQTPLDIAASDKIREVFGEQLLQEVARSNIGSVCQLIAAGVDVNMKDTPQSENTPLHWAASYGNRDVIQCLVKRGGNVNAVNKLGATPLHDAVKRGDLQVLEELLVSGSDPHFTSMEGKYAAISPLAAAQNKEKVLELLEKHQGQHTMNGFMENGNGTINQSVNSGPTDQSTPLSPSTPNGVLHLNMENASFVQGTNADSASLTSPTLSAVSNTSQMSVVTDSRLHLLWPQPRKITQRHGKPFKPEGVLLIYVSDPAKEGISHTIGDMWLNHEHYLAQLSLVIHVETYTENLPQGQRYLISQINSSLFSHSQSYRLTITENMVRLDASDKTGLHFGITTFIQLLKLCQQDGIPPLQIQDRPSLGQRGFMLDMSKGRVPTVTSMRHLILILSYLKVNQLQLYTRCQVPKDPSIRWQFPYTRSTLLELDKFAQCVCVTLTPVVDILPNVTFDDLPDIYSSFEQYISCFSSTSVLGVGPRLSSFLLDISDDGRISSDDTRRLLPVPANHTVQLCAFMFHEAPSALLQFPQNTVLAEYGFQANYDFAGYCKSIEESGVPFSVVPGTAAWNSLAGCPEAAVSNIYGAVQTAVAADALGVTVSHWSGVGHITHHPVCLTGILTAAGLGWNSSIHLDFLHSNLAELLNIHILNDTAAVTGQVILELGRAETYILRCSRNQAATDNSKLPAEKGSTLYQLLSNPDSVNLEHLSHEIFQKSMRHIRKCQSELQKAKLLCADGPTVISELQITADLMLAASRMGRALLHAGKNPIASSGYKVINPGVSNLVATAKTDLANRLLSQLEVYRSVWLQRNLPQGFSESLRVFSSLVKQLIPDGPLPFSD